MVRLMAFCLVLLLSGCALIDDTRDAAEDLLVLRSSWEVPARQAGVYDEALAHVASLDAAILSGDLNRVYDTLLAFEPVYLEIYASVDNPTPEQQAFHARVVSLWEKIETSGDAAKWLELAAILVRVIVARV